MAARESGSVKCRAANSFAAYPAANSHPRGFGSGAGACVSWAQIASSENVKIRGETRLGEGNRGEESAGIGQRFRENSSEEHCDAGRQREVFLF